MDEVSASALKMAMEKATEPGPGPTQISTAASRASDAPDNNEIFSKLVSADDDIVGLVAYSLYKQNKIDWMRAFESRYSRLPNEMEFAAYIVGENTPRRVATYRFLAESTVNKSTSVGGVKFGNVSTRPLLSATMNVFYGLVGIGLVAAFIVLVRFVFSLKHGGA